MSIIPKSGIALDIDDTLSQTLLYWVKQLKAKFGNPEKLSDIQIVQKYKHTRNIPYWDTPEVSRYIQEMIHSNELQEHFPVIDNASEMVQLINTIVPIVCYISVRPMSVMNGTQKWLDMHGFPKAPLLFRPESVEHTNGSVWKAQTLIENYPKVVGVVDNDETLLDSLPSDYPGYVYLFGYHSIKTHLKDHVVPCPDWSSVANAIRRNHTATTIS